MRKVAFVASIFILLSSGTWFADILQDRKTLRDHVIRLHVVAASDSCEDQALKLKVRDAILAELEQTMQDITDPQLAHAYLTENLTKLQDVANRVLLSSGYDATVVVSLARESFNTRQYDTFSLPAGVYDALRITIGEGEGKNWWCVVFPTLCIPATSDGFEQLAEESGMEEALACALAGEEGYEVRFYLLDVMGRLENLLYRG